MSAALPRRGAGAAGHGGPAVSRRFDHVRALFVQTPASLIGNLIGWCLIAPMYWPLAPRAPAAGLEWSLAALLLALRLAHYLRFRRNPDADERHAAALAPQLEACWCWRRRRCGALAVWLFWGLGTPYHLTALMLIVVQPTAWPRCSCWPRSSGCSSSSSAWCWCRPSCASPPTPPSPGTGSWPASCACCSSSLLVMGRAQRSALDQVIRLKAHTDKLAAQLQRREGRADAARRAAEAASRAKTQFFAAASHDLRQPLHAMGLFAEALRQRSHDPEVASLVNSINESVDALEGLFGELLDITRIDTGGVDVNPAPVPMRELFARLRLHFEPTAFEKGLALSFHGERHVAFADPVLLERILRNLVSNAIRYTDDGGVLVSCRQRGDKLLMQVWDSGIGISEASAAAHLRRVLPGAEPAAAAGAPAQGPGPGAGHRRAAGGAAGSADRGALARRPRHGVLASRCRRARWCAPLEPAVARAKAPLGLTLQGRLMLLVEDEPAVREGLVVLLKAWGASVLDFDSVASLQAWLAAARAEAPDLLLVDYRLPQGHDRPGRAGRGARRTGRGARCRPSSSPAAPSAATRARPPSTTSTC